jgi:5-methylcytosine-specific restriction enzyme subunit McrC
MEDLITLQEYARIAYRVCKDPKDEGLNKEENAVFITKESLDQLEILTSDVHFLEIRHDYLKARNYAGVAKIGNLKIEILPKFFEDGDIQAEKTKIMNNLLYMLQHSNLFNFKELDSADLDIKNDFLEVFIYLFAKNLAHLLKNQQDRQYLKHDDELRFVREKIITAQYSSNPARLHIIPCRFHERSMDTLLNQTIKYTAFLLSKQVKSQETNRYLKYIISLLDATNLTQIHPSEIKKIKFNRLNKPFIPYIRFCDLVLRHATLTLQASHVEFFSLMIPMEKLFEEFIAQMLVNNPEILPLEYRQNIQIQKMIGYLAFDGDHELFQMKADVFLDGPRRIILDTKYKMLDPEDSKNKISQSDLYQMFAYCKESGSNTAILLYPEGINAEIPNRTLKLGIEQSITLYVKTIPLHFDLSKEEEVQKFIYELSNVFDFLWTGTEKTVMRTSVEETAA